MVKQLFLAILVLSNSLYAGFRDYMDLNQADSQRLNRIKWNSPSIEDLSYLQSLYNRQIHNLFKYFDHYDTKGNPQLSIRRSRAKNFKFYENSLKEIPSFKVVKLGKEGPTKNCIVLYTGLNGPWQNGIKQTLNKIRKSGFNGHVLYQVGGWPYIKGGGLKAFFTPYGFKPCAVMEVMSRGYDQVLWLDVPLLPKKNLNQIFNQISKRNIWLFEAIYQFDCIHFAEKIRNDSTHLLKYFNMTPQQIFRVKHVRAGAVGFNLRSIAVRNLIKRWYQMVIDCTPFLYCNPEQLSLSILVNMYSSQISQPLPIKVFKDYFSVNANLSTAIEKTNKS